MIEGKSQQPPMKKEPSISEELIDIRAEAISEDQGLRLDNQLCFALYVMSKEIIRNYKTLLKPLGLTYTSYMTM